MAYLTPGAMAILQARRQFNTGQGQAEPFNGTIGVEPPVPIGPPATAIYPPPPADRSTERAQKIRQWQMQNPGRAAPRMGRNADGSINWDRSTGIGAAGYAEDQRRAAAAAEAAQRITTPTNLGPGNLGGGAATNPTQPPYKPNYPPGSLDSLLPGNLGGGAATNPSSDPSKQPAMTSMMGPGSLDSLPPGLMAILAARMGANMGERNDNDRPSLMGGAFGKGGPRNVGVI